MDLKTIENLAILARINLDQAEKESLLKDLNYILKYIEEINEAKIEEEKEREKEEEKFTTRLDLVQVKNQMREDEKPDAPGEFSKELLAAAAKTKDNFIKVKKVL
ncbi:MAG TPA: Asp-tRNA(Asn)/Glu-tRNA(Gln) amidotransferase subunit GatC [Candidatus Paceibacterota bacterium]|nr:Asp-tRNA(Asn)/Glu-tRNA(Gln) amidotransferase subunit GatC [Candidatus Paceibacterota bacterium]